MPLSREEDLAISDARNGQALYEAMIPLTTLSKSARWDSFRERRKVFYDKRTKLSDLLDGYQADKLVLVEKSLASWNSRGLLEKHCKDHALLLRKYNAAQILRKHMLINPKNFTFDQVKKTLLEMNLCKNSLEEILENNPLFNQLYSAKIKADSELNQILQPPAQSIPAPNSAVPLSISTPAPDDSGLGTADLKTDLSSEASFLSANDLRSPSTLERSTVDPSLGEGEKGTSEQVSDQSNANFSVLSTETSHIEQAPLLPPRRPNLPGYDHNRLTPANSTESTPETIISLRLAQAKANAYLKARFLSVWLIDHHCGWLVKLVSPLRYRKIELVREFLGKLLLQAESIDSKQFTPLESDLNTDMQTAVRDLKRIGITEISNTQGLDPESQYEKAFSKNLD